jgi:hypothetical protein
MQAKLKWHRLAAGVLLAATAGSITGCSGGGVGDTVPSPPRSLVEKTGPRPPAMSQSNSATAPTTNVQGKPDGGK